MEADKSEPAVMVTTEHRGVFFGYAEGYTPGDAVIHLKRARNCIYWPSEQKGFLGLASEGPVKGARVGPPAERLELRAITSVARLSEASAKAWEQAPWSR